VIGHEGEVTEPRDNHAAEKQVADTDENKGIGEVEGGKTNLEHAVERF